jgi:multiple sugar transport system substrate-binding protein
MAKTGLRLGALVVVSAVALSACGNSTPTSSPSPTLAGSARASFATPPTTPPGTTLRWFVGLDQGNSTAQIAAEKAFVSSYNSFNKDGITLKLEVVPTASASVVLKTEMAAGNAPDIVGPLGVADFNGFEGLFLNLSSYIQNYKVDLAAYDPALLTVLQQSDLGQLGLPYLISPGYIWYNKTIFAAAGLPNLPTHVGDLYQGQTWDWNELAKVAEQLTVDKSGKKSTDAGFDPKNIVRYGLDFQGTDLRRLASGFGSGEFVGSDGKTAQIPAAWADALTWYYAGIWGANPFIPNALAESSALLNEGNSQSSGNVAMNVGWATSIPSIATDANSSVVKTWDIAVMPSWKGTTTSPMYMDTFSITRASKNPDAAFKTMLAIMADSTLLKAYGGEPAKTADQEAYFNAYDQALSSIFPGNQVTWSVLTEMQKHPAVPSFEADMPGFAQSSADINALLTRLQSTNGLDVVAELTKLQTTLQADFDASQPLVSQ